MADSSRSRTPLIIALLLLATGAIVASLFWSYRAPEVQVQRPALDLKTWKTYTAELRKTPPPTGDQVDAVRDAFHSANRAEVAAGPDPSKNYTFLGTIQMWERAAVTLTQTADTRAYFLLGRWEGLRLIETLSTFLQHCKSANLSVTACLESDPAPTPVAAYIDAGGAFVRFAERGGFIEEGQLVEKRIPMLQAVFLHHWSGVLRRRATVATYFSPIELSWLNRWRVEWQADAPIEVRLKAVDQLVHLPEYPVDLNAGALLYQAGRFSEAAERFAKVDSALAHKWLRAARKRASAPQ